MKAIIPAWWNGTRMLPFTKTVSKELLPVWTKPILQYIIEGLEYAGIEDIGIITSPWKNDIKKHFQKNENLEQILKRNNKEKLLEKLKEATPKSNISYIKQKKLLWLADAIFQAKKYIKWKDYFMVVLGDTIFPYEIFKEMIEFFRKNQQPVLLLQEVQREKVHMYWVAEINNWKITDFVEKPSREEAPSNLSIAGVYILPCEIFKYIKEVPLDEKTWEKLLPDVLKKMLGDYTFLPYTTDKKIRDTGNPEARLQANIEIMKEEENSK